jgi:hypothetical protein
VAWARARVMTRGTSGRGGRRSVVGGVCRLLLVPLGRRRVAAGSFVSVAVGVGRNCSGALLGSADGWLRGTLDPISHDQDRFLSSGGGTVTGATAGTVPASHGPPCVYVVNDTIRPIPGAGRGGLVFAQSLQVFD